MSPTRRRHYKFRLKPKQLHESAMDEFRRELEEIKLLKDVLRERYLQECREVWDEGHKAAVSIQRILRGKKEREKRKRLNPLPMNAQTDLGPLDMGLGVVGLSISPLAVAPGHGLGGQGGFPLQPAAVPAKTEPGGVAPQAKATASEPLVPEEDTPQAKVAPPTQEAPESPQQSMHEVTEQQKIDAVVESPLRVEEAEGANNNSPVHEASPAAPSPVASDGSTSPASELVEEASQSQASEPKGAPAQLARKEGSGQDEGEELDAGALVSHADSNDDGKSDDFGDDYSESQSSARASPRTSAHTRPESADQPAAAADPDDIESIPEINSPEGNTVDAGPTGNALVDQQAALFRQARQQSQRSNNFGVNGGGGADHDDDDDDDGGLADLIELANQTKTGEGRAEPSEIDEPATSATEAIELSRAEQKLDWVSDDEAVPEESFRSSIEKEDKVVAKEEEKDAAPFASANSQQDYEDDDFEDLDCEEL